MLATIESMDVEIANWLGLIFRFVHVVAAIMWIGNSLLFTWMEINLLTPNPEKDGQDPNLLGKLDMLHGGGVFHMEKRLINHTSIPVPLHWFMWQSYTTWITGSLLLATMFYLNGGSSFVDVTKSEISGSTAITLSVLGIVGWWLIYDLIWRSKLKELPRIAIPLTMGLLILAAMGFDQVFNGRALYLQIGVMMGSSMTANVFFHIIRNQKQFMKSLLAGESHDLEYGKQAKTRSMHNHYMTFPVLFMMLSAHFPQLTSPTNRVAILAVIMVMLMGIKFLMNSRNHFKKWHLSIASLTLIGCVFISFLLMDAKAGKSADIPASITGGKLFINKGCAACHITGGSQIAPDLTNVYLSQRRLGDDTTVVADNAYLKQSIVAPQAKLVKGYAPAMPAYDSLEEAEISLLIAYLKSL